MLQLKHSLVLVRQGLLFLLLLSMPTACAYCVDTTVHPAAVDHLRWCAEYVKNDKLTEAEARCRLALEFSPKYAEAYNQLGLIAVHRGRPEVARERFKHAISLKNDFAEAHNNLGYLFNESKDFGAACDEFRQAIEIDPGFINARLNLAYCYRSWGEPDNARREFVKCMELDPETCDCRLGLGVLALEGIDGLQGEQQRVGLEQAKGHFQRLTEICPTYAEGFYNLGTTYQHLSRCAEAVDAHLNALSLKPDFLEARQNLTVAYQCLGLQDGAVKAFSIQIEQDPSDPEPHFKLGRLYEERKDYRAALLEYQSAIRLYPKFSRAYYRAAIIYDAMLNASKTVEMCRGLIEEGDDKLVSEAMQWCRERVKQLQFD